MGLGAQSELYVSHIFVLLFAPPFELLSTRAWGTALFHLLLTLRSLAQRYDALKEGEETMG